MRKDEIEQLQICLEKINELTKGYCVFVSEIHDKLDEEDNKRLDDIEMKTRNLKYHLRKLVQVIKANQL